MGHHNDKLFANLGARFGYIFIESNAEPRFAFCPTNSKNVAISPL